MKRREFLSSAVGTAGVCLCGTSGSGAFNIAVSTSTTALPEDKPLPTKVQKILRVTHYLLDNDHTAIREYHAATLLNIAMNEAGQAIFEICAGGIDKIPALCVPVVRVLNWSASLIMHEIDIEFDSEQAVDSIFKYFAENIHRMDEFGKHLSLYYFHGMDVQMEIKATKYYRDEDKWKEYLFYEGELR